MTEYYNSKNKTQSTQSTQYNLLFYMENCKTCNFFITTAHKSNLLKNFKMICVDGQKEKFKAQGLKKVPTIIIPSINKQFEGSDCLKWLEEMIKLTSKNNFTMHNEELIIPNVGITHTNTQNNNFIPPIPPITSNYPNYPNNQNPNLINDQVTQLTSKISILSNQINKPSQSNQFEVPKTNVIKRNVLNPIQPPNIINNSNQNIKIINANSNQQNNINLNNNQSQPSVKKINQLFGFLQNEMSGLSDGYAYVNVDNPLPKSFLPPDKDMEIYTAPEGDKVDKKKQEQLVKIVEMERTNDREQFKNTIDEINRRIAMGEHNLLPKWTGTNNDL